MSNPSLKEQLQSLGLSAPPETHKKNIKKQGSVKAKQQKPAWLEYAQYGVELLRAHFPLCFKENKEISPLKVGIKQDLVKHLSTREDIVVGDKACMVSALSYYVNSPAYHKNMLEGVMRIDLEGNSTNVVTKEEAQYSLECRKAKLQKKQLNQTGVTKEPETINT